MAEFFISIFWVEQIYRCSREKNIKSIKYIFNIPESIKDTDSFQQERTQGIFLPWAFIEDTIRDDQ